jgi:phospholipid transport system substrate-binding protein
VTRVRWQFFGALATLLLALLPVSARATDGADAQALVRATADKVLAEVRANKARLDRDSSGIYDLVQRHVVPHFDFTRMTQSAMGRYWRSATEEQRSALVREFQEMLVRTYAVALLNYSGQQIEYLPLRASAVEDDVMVQTKVSDAGAPPIPIDYRLSRTVGSWKVYDVTIDGVSLVSNYRSTFAEQVQRNGVDGLIRQLSDRNRQLRG